MIFINLSKIEQDLLEFAKAKDDFETLWISKGAISERMRIAEFVSCIDLQKTTLFIKRENIYVAVSYMISEKNEYMFYYADIDLTINDKNFLESTKYLDNLKTVSPYDLAESGVSTPQDNYYYIIDGNFKVLSN